MPYEKALQGALSLFSKLGPREEALRAAVVGPKKELYFSPKSLSTDERKKVFPALRQMIEDGIVAPSYMLDTPKTQDAARIAGAILERGLPKNMRGYTPDPWHDSVVIRPSMGGDVADAAAMLDSPQSLHNPDFMYLHDLAANVDAPGSGLELLNSILKGPLYEDASRMLFTPLPGARDFYKQKFGMRYLSPAEAESDPAIDALVGAAGQRHNAEDLGVGIIRRAQGGLACLKGKKHG